MPTQIPVHVEPSYMAEAIAALMLSLIAAAIDGAIFFIIVLAYGQALLASVGGDAHVTAYSQGSI